MRRRKHRGGYALVLVLLFTVLLLSLSAVAYRYIGAAVRIETARTAQAKRDEGSVRALAKSLALLETGTPPISPFACGLVLVTSSGPRAFTITMTELAPGQWTVNVAPSADGDSLDPLPESFAVSLE